MHALGKWNRFIWELKLQAVPIGERITDFQVLIYGIEVRLEATLGEGDTVVAIYLNSHEGLDLLYKFHWTFRSIRHKIDDRKCYHG